MTRRFARWLLQALEIDDAALAERVLKGPPQARAASAAVVARLRRVLDRRRGEVVVEQWTGDVPTEVLHWIPFLRWVLARFRIDPSRFVTSSASAVPVWYEAIGMRYADPVPKGSAPTIPISVLKDLFGGYWAGLFPLWHVRAHSRFERLAAPPIDMSPTRMYTVTAGDVEGFAGLAVPVDGMTLSQQSAVVAAADAVVARYGTDAVALGACHGVRTIAVHQRGEAAAARADVLRCAAVGAGGSFVLIDATQLELAALLRGARG
jgi:hypothetical protein